MDAESVIMLRPRFVKNKAVLNRQLIQILFAILASTATYFMLVFY